MSKSSNDNDAIIKLQDHIYELEADRRRLLLEREEQQKESEELREQLEVLREAHQQLQAERGPRVIVQRGSDEENVYFASARKRHFHRPNCEWAQYILMSSNLIEFSSHAEAVQAGYKPCKTCRS